MLSMSDLLTLCETELCYIAITEYLICPIYAQFCKLLSAFFQILSQMFLLQLVLKQKSVFTDGCKWIDTIIYFLKMEDEKTLTAIFNGSSFSHLILFCFLKMKGSKVLHPQKCRCPSLFISV